MAWPQKGDIAPCFASIAQANGRLEPLAVGIEQGDQGNGNVKFLGCKRHDFVEALFGWRVEQQQGIQGRQPFGLIRRCGSRDHMGHFSTVKHFPCRSIWISGKI